VDSFEKKLSLKKRPCALVLSITPVFVSRDREMRKDVFVTGELPRS